MEDVGYMNILSGYLESVLQDFKSHLRTEIDLVEDDIRLVLDKYNSSFIVYELEPGIYTCKDLSEALFYILQSEYPASNSEILIRLDAITRKTKLVVRPGIIAKSNFLLLSLASTMVGIINTIFNILVKKL